MEELQGFDGSEEELVRELLDNDSPFFLLPEISSTDQTEHCSTTEHLFSDSVVTNRLVSNVYSGPTIEDIETALSLKNTTTESTNHSVVSRVGVSILEKGLSKVDNKYTLKIKSFGDGMSDDGYKWRKYGQKSIKNSSNPRSYYRCTNPRCSAKKQVERSNEDPDVLIVTYEGLHLHFTYSHFLPTQTQPQPHYPYPSIKKPKFSSNSSISTSQNQEEDKVEAQALETLSLVLEPTTTTHTNPAVVRFQEDLLFEGVGSQGLLEDMIPIMIRNPPSKNNSTTTTFSNSSCSSSHPSSPPTDSSSSFSWSPNCSSFDVGVISSTTIYEGL